MPSAKTVSVLQAELQNAVGAPRAPARFQSLWIWFGRLSVLLLAAWAAGRVTRDANWWTAQLFYIPSPVVAFALVVPAIVAARKRQRQRAWFFTGLLCLPAVFIFGVENRFWLGAMKTTADYRVVHWNLCWGTFGYDGIHEKLEELDADLIVLSEVHSEFAEEYFPGHHVWQYDTLMAISRFPLENFRNLSKGKSEFYCLTWRSPTREVELLVADIPATLSVPRGPHLEALRQHMATALPDLVLGDLNAPRRSIVLTDLPDGYAHAYESVGSGVSYTWPSLLPLFAIDHCMYGPRILPVSYDLETSWSDHRVQVFDFAVR